jgi:hypothetical protein
MKRRDLAAELTLKPLQPASGRRLRRRQERKSVYG